MVYSCHFYLVIIILIRISLKVFFFLGVKFVEFLSFVFLFYLCTCFKDIIYRYIIIVVVVFNNITVVLILVFYGIDTFVLLLLLVNCFEIRFLLWLLLFFILILLLLFTPFDFGRELFLLF